MRLSPVPVFVLYQLFFTVKKASPGSVYCFYSVRFSDSGTVSVFPRSILCTPSESISCSGSYMQRSLLLRHLVRRRTNSSVFLLGNLLVSSGFLSAKPHRSRRISGTKSHETKRRQYRKKSPSGRKKQDACGKTGLRNLGSHTKRTKPDCQRNS